MRSNENRKMPKNTRLMLLTDTHGVNAWKIAEMMGPIMKTSSDTRITGRILPKFWKMIDMSIAYTAAGTI